MTAPDAITRAKQIVRSECYYPAGRSLERLEDLAQGALDESTEDETLRIAIREEAGNELYDSRREAPGAPEGGFPGHSEDA